MLKLSDENAAALRDAVAAATAVPGLLGQVDALYAQVQQAIDARKPRCDISGRCCRFEDYGHRLFVTTVDLAHFVARLDRPIPADWDGTGCPFQVAKRCTTHTIRPFGCRIFFCDPTADEWQQDQYETFHLQLKQLHASADVPYLYVEWREGLRALLAG